MSGLICDKTDKLGKSCQRYAAKVSIYCGDYKAQGNFIDEPMIGLDPKAIKEPQRTL